MDTAKEIAAKFKEAIVQGRTDVVCALISELQKGDNAVLQQVLNEQLTEHGTLLHYTTKSEKADIIRALLSVLLNYVIVILLGKLGKADIIRALLSGGADPGIQNKERKLPLELGTKDIVSVYNEELLQATAQSNLGRVCQLVAAGVDVNLVDSNESKNTPLHWAVSYANRDMVQCLCSRGANVNVYNNEGYKQLYYLYYSQRSQYECGEKKDCEKEAEKHNCQCTEGMHCIDKQCYCGFPTNSNTTMA
ncbi:hypothetical protein LOTGIDRAFT_173616 [Lottia gigantea]|uniref:Uncharacterized protein n=1 Tax=Lottia gigantea TaxID=225164 RepID=V4A6W2_LOTGI|nr:hypothetical protein LOTGIDRAFT_173616 [Lottia gigantea]ESO99673.1 hypothetical protein LOTGIDRAFT_173616 [Lottia gigantea]